MAAPWEKYQSDIPEASGPWAKYGASGEQPDAFANGPLKIGADGFADALREELKGTDWATRNIAGAGSAVVNAWEGLKQFAGQGDKREIEAQRIIRDAAPVGAFVGDAALTAIPFGMAGTSLKAAGAVGAGYGALQPVSGDQTAENIAQGKLANTALGGAFGVAGQAVANKAGQYLSSKLAEMAERKAKNAVFDQTLKESLDAGYKVPPSMMPDSGVTSRTLEGFSGKIKTNQLAGIKNQAITDSLARKALGLPDDAPLTSETMQALRGGAFDVGYKPVTGAGTISTDDAYREALGSLVENYQGAARSFPGAVSDDVTGLVMGTQVGGTPDKRIFVDGLGQIVKNVDIPPQPKTRNLLSELKKGGGLNPSELSDLGVEGVKKSGLLNKNGRTMDGVVEWMEQHGWISANDIAMAEKNGVGGSHELARDMLRAALNKEPVIHPLDGDAVYSYSQALRNLDDLGIKQVKIPGTEATTKGGLNVADFDAGDAIKMSQILRDNANKAFRDGDAGLGKAAKGAAKALEDQIERHLSGLGKDGEKMLKNFRQARMLMAKAHTVEDAVREGGGRVDATKLANRFQSGKPLSGELKTIGQFANNFRDVAKIPASGNANPLTALDFMFGTPTGILAGIGGGPLVGAAVGAGTMAGRVGARNLLLSDLLQRGVSRPDYAVGLPTRAAGRFFQNAPVAGTVGGLYAFGQ